MRRSQLCAMVTLTMNTLFRVLASVFFVIWSLVGVVLLFGMLVGLSSMKAGGPQGMMGSFAPKTDGSESQQDAATQQEFSPELKACAIKVFGEARVTAVINGASPSFLEIQKLTAACGSFIK